jgi:hypothetical protein
MFDDLNEENVLLYSIKAYDKPNCILSEYEEDNKRFNYINRLFTRYKNYGELRERLVINHLVVLCNVFGPEVATRLLFFNVNEDFYSYLKTYLLFLNIMPEKIKGIRGRDIFSSDIKIDENIADTLRQYK